MRVEPGDVATQCVGESCNVIVFAMTIIIILSFNLYNNPYIYIYSEEYAVLFGCS